MARGIRTPVVFTLEDLKKIYDEDAHDRKGMWSFHRNFHKGHEQCRRLTLQNSDWVMGILWNNVAAGIEKLVGKTVDYDDGINPVDVNILKNDADVVMIFTGDYHPYLEYKDFVYKVLKEDFSEKRLKETGILDNIGMLGPLVYSVAVRLLIHEIYGMKMDYDGNSSKESWKMSGYGPWCMKRFGINVDLAPPVLDEFGNACSTTKMKLPEYLGKRVNKQLLYPHFSTIEEVIENIKDIEGLKARDFSRSDGLVRCYFYFDEEHRWPEAIQATE